MIFKFCGILISNELTWCMYPDNINPEWKKIWATRFACIAKCFILNKITWALATVPYHVLISKENTETLRTDPRDLSRWSLCSPATQRRPQGSTRCGSATTIPIPTMYTSRKRGKTLSIHLYPQWCPQLSLLLEIFPMHFQSGESTYLLDSCIYCFQSNLDEEHEEGGLYDKMCILVKSNFIFLN